MPSAKSLIDRINTLDISLLSHKEKALMGLWVIGSWDEPVSMASLVDYVYGSGLYGDARKSKYGHLHRIFLLLRKKGVVTRYEKPVRYRLKYCRATVTYFQWIFRKRYNFVVPDDYFQL